MLRKLIEIIETEEYDVYSVDIDLDLFVEYGISNISLLLNADDDDHDKHLIIINQMIQQFNKSKSYVYSYLLFTQVVWFVVLLLLFR